MNGGTTCDGCGCAITDRVEFNGSEFCTACASDALYDFEEALAKSVRLVSKIHELTAIDAEDK